MNKVESSLVVQWVKDPKLLLHWLGSLLWHGFEPWSGNFYMPWAWPKKKKKTLNWRWSYLWSGFLGSLVSVNLALLVYTWWLWSQRQSLLVKEKVHTKLKKSYLASKYVDWFEGVEVFVPPRFLLLLLLLFSLFYSCTCGIWKFQG